MKTYALNPIGSMYGIFIYLHLPYKPNVGKYTSPMDPMGIVDSDVQGFVSVFSFESWQVPIWPTFWTSLLCDPPQRTSFVSGNLERQQRWYTPPRFFFCCLKIHGLNLNLSFMRHSEGNGGSLNQLWINEGQGVEGTWSINPTRIQHHFAAPFELYRGLNYPFI